MSRDYDEYGEGSCPCCGRPLSYTSYSEDCGVVESEVRCSCGYAKGYSYGGRFLELPDGWNEDENGEIVEDEE
jgi:hypothetical protein